MASTYPITAVVISAGPDHPLPSSVLQLHQENLGVKELVVKANNRLTVAQTTGTLPEGHFHGGSTEQSSPAERRLSVSQQADPRSDR